MVTQVLCPSTRKQEASGSLSWGQPGLQRQSGLHRETLPKNQRNQESWFTEYNSTRSGFLFSVTLSHGVSCFLLTHFLTSFLTLKVLTQFPYLCLGYFWPISSPLLGKACATPVCVLKRPQCQLSTAGSFSYRICSIPSQIQCTLHSAVTWLKPPVADAFGLPSGWVSFLAIQSGTMAVAVVAFVCLFVINRAEQIGSLKGRVKGHYKA